MKMQSELRKMANATQNECGFHSAKGAQLLQCKKNVATAMQEKSAVVNGQRAWERPQEESATDADRVARGAWLSLHERVWPTPL